MFIGAKHYAALTALAALAAGGCSELGLERFAPPGIVKYEDLAKDTPPNPEIAARVKEVKAERDGGYPRLSEQPQQVPAAAPAAERETIAAELRAERDALESEVAAERAASLEERAAGVVLPGDGGERSLDEAAAALDEAVARADEEARRERGLPAKASEPNEH